MILVDPRVGSEQFLEPLAKRVNCPVLFAKPRLAGGDFAFDGHGPGNEPYSIGIELKVLGDMLGSMRSGRLAGEQLHTMNKIYNVCYVIVQGEWKPDTEGALVTPRWTRDGGKSTKRWVRLNLAAKSTGPGIYFRYSELDRHLNSLEVIKDVMILRSLDENETVHQIVNRFNWWQKNWEDHDSTDPIKLQTELSFTKVSLMRKLASELPGIGWHRSKEVEKTFINIHHMVNAPLEAWMDIPGIGKTTATKVWSALRERV